ncbi:MAG: hypothetical protein IEMM0007_1432 [bacterium]|nr:MAG: hypothetical protein IEMM0007_1432 [bacterium]
MIDGGHKLPLTRQSEILRLSRSSLYYKAVSERAGELEVMRHIDEIYLKYPFYGSRRIRDELCGMGYKVGRGHVITLMKEDGNRGSVRKSPIVTTRSIRTY